MWRLPAAPSDRGFGVNPRTTPAGNAGSPPTSSWWALETPLTLARRGQVGGQARGDAAVAARSEERSRRHHRHMCP